MNLGLVTLTFTESVNTDSLNVTQISFQYDFNETSPLFTFSETTVTESTNGTTVILNTGLSDLNQLKMLTKLAISNETTFLSITMETILDMNGNPVIPIQPSSALQVNTFTTDTTPPELLSYILDLDREILTLSFSETVNASSADVRALSILSSQDSSILVTLTEGNNSLIYERVIFLSPDDLNLLKSITKLVTNEMTHLYLHRAIWYKTSLGTPCSPSLPPLPCRLMMCTLT